MDNHTASPADDVTVPPEVAAAWGLTPIARRGPRAALTLDRIVDAAIRIGDAHGLSAISMAKIADELGFTTMSLYRHIGSKEELLAHVQDQTMGAPPTVDRSSGWRESLAHWIRNLIKALSAHPWALDIPINAPPLMPRSIQWLDAALQIMDDLPLSPAEKMSTTLLLSGYAHNEATLAARVAAGPAGTNDDDYEKILRQLVHPDRLPGLHAILETESLFAHNSTEPDDADDFFMEFAIARILDGIQTHITGQNLSTDQR